MPMEWSLKLDWSEKSSVSHCTAFQLLHKIIQHSSYVTGSELSGRNLPCFKLFTIITLQHLRRSAWTFYQRYTIINCHWTKIHLITSCICWFLAIFLKNCKYHKLHIIIRGWMGFRREVEGWWEWVGSTISISKMDLPDKANFPRPNHTYTIHYTPCTQDLNMCLTLCACHYWSRHCGIDLTTPESRLTADKS